MMGHWWRKGFTIIEVTLFIAVSSLLFIGVLTSIGTRVSDQRYSDSVNDFAEFLRNVYNEVGNTVNLRQGSGDGGFRKKCTLWSTNDGDRKPDGSVGRSDCAIYGKMILFNWDGSGTPYTYDLAGNAVDLYHELSDSSSALNSLKSVGAGILAENCTNASHSSCTKGYAGSETKYMTPWQHRIENTDKTGDNLASYTIVIARVPTDNTIHTFRLKTNRGSINMGNALTSSAASSTNSPLRVADNNYEELNTAIDFCIDQDTNGGSNNRRRNVRLNAGANSADAVEIVQMDNTATGGNACL